MPDKIRVLVADDHAVFRAGVISTLNAEAEVEVVGEAQNGAEAIERFRAVRPDVVLMDLQMPVLDGIAATTVLRRDYPAAKVVVLTTYSGDVQAMRAIRAGAAAYILKSVLSRELGELVRAVHAGKRYIPPEIANAIAFNGGEEPLSEREQHTLRLASLGLSNKEIGHKLGISEDTVKGHFKSIFAKLDVRDRTQAVLNAVRRGIITV